LPQINHCRSIDCNSNFLGEALLQKSICKKYVGPIQDRLRLVLNVMHKDLVPPGVPRPRILISNDDGVNAPGLRALVAELHVEEFCDILVCGPSSEKSAQSHAITLGKELVCSPIQIDGNNPCTRSKSCAGG
jgi:Survival protein SurE